MRGKSDQTPVSSCGTSPETKRATILMIAKDLSNQHKQLANTFTSPHSSRDYLYTTSNGSGDSYMVQFDFCNDQQMERHVNQLLRASTNSRHSQNFGQKLTILDSTTTTTTTTTTITTTNAAANVNNEDDWLTTTTTGGDAQQPNSNNKRGNNHNNNNSSHRISAIVYVINLLVDYDWEQTAISIESYLKKQSVNHIPLFIIGTKYMMSNNNNINNNNQQQVINRAPLLVSNNNNKNNTSNTNNKIIVTSETNHNHNSSSDLSLTITQPNTSQQQHHHQLPPQQQNNNNNNNNNNNTNTNNNNNNNSSNSNSSTTTNLNNNSHNNFNNNSNNTNNNQNNNNNNSNHSITLIQPNWTTKPIHHRFISNDTTMTMDADAASLTDSFYGKVVDETSESMVDGGSMADDMAPCVLTERVLNFVDRSTLFEGYLETDFGIYGSKQDVIEAHLVLEPVLRAIHRVDSELRKEPYLKRKKQGGSNNTVGRRRNFSLPISLFCIPVSMHSQHSDSDSSPGAKMPQQHTPKSSGGGEKQHKRLSR